MGKYGTWWLTPGPAGRIAVVAPAVHGESSCWLFTCVTRHVVHHSVQVATQFAAPQRSAP